MTNNIKEILKNLTGDNKDTLEQLLYILNLPDEIFDSSFNDIKESVKNIYNNTAIQREILDIISTNPDFDIEEEKANIENVIKEIQSDETLSSNKKELLEVIIRNSIDTLFELKENPRQRINVKIELEPNAQLPKYAHSSDAGADIFALEETTIAPHETKIVHTGIKIDMPAGYAIFIYPRSGLSLKTNLRIANSVGVVDSDFHKEIGVIITNIGDTSYTIKAKERIAQMIIMPVPMIAWQKSSVEDNERGGFGSTGV